MRVPPTWYGCWAGRWTRVFARPWPSGAACRTASATAGHVSAAPYDPISVEKKWQRKWAADAGSASQSDDVTADGRPHKYILAMFPYPSGDLHMGHVRVYTISDSLARYWRMRGHNVMHPMGWDAFGLPAENAARDRGIDAAVWTKQNVASMRKQLDQLGMSFDWSQRQLSTCHPEYYRWTQHLFLRLHRAGLVYRANAAVNYDPVDQTVLANEQVDAQGRSWRSGAVVERRVMPQWFVGITSMADQLLAGLDQLADHWPAQVLALQKNWIGRSTGATIEFAGIETNGTGTAGQQAADWSISVFTTKPETLFGVTFVALSTNHPLLPAARGLVPHSHRAAVDEFLRTRSQADRADREPDSAGVFTGLYVRNPVASTDGTRSREPVPVFVANYVLDAVGSGAVMGVPCHDQRDAAFAEHHAIERGAPTVQEPQGDPKGGSAASTASAAAGAAIMVNSGPYSSLAVTEGAARLVADGERDGWASASVHYRLRDWLVSRQRHWGTPIPMVHCQHCPEPVPVPDDQLPVLLDSPDRVPCPRCGAPDQPRELDTMDTFVDSAWYWARYCSARDRDHLVRPADAARWLPVDVYIGGVEHAILHLLYARFVGHFLHQEGLVPSAEPFPRLLAQGMVLGRTFRDQATGRPVPSDQVDAARKEGRALSERWEKMSKSKYNGVNPTSVVQTYGADTARLFVLFKAPAPAALEWDEGGVRGMSRWLQRLHRLVDQVTAALDAADAGSQAEHGGDDEHDTRAAGQLMRMAARTIEQVERDIERDQFNTAISALMIMSNEAAAALAHDGSPPTADSALGQAQRDCVRALVLMLAPFAPHIAAELWERLSRALVLRGAATVDSVTWAGRAAEPDVFRQQFPRLSADKVALRSHGAPVDAPATTSTIVVQVGGRGAGRLEWRDGGVEGSDSAGAAPSATQALELARDSGLFDRLKRPVDGQSARLIRGKKPDTFILSVQVLKEK